MKWHDLTNDILEIIFKDIELELYKPRGFSSWRSFWGLLTAFLISLFASHSLGVIEIPLVSFSLPVLIGAYSTIFATEVDANSPENAVLWGKVKGNFDFLFAKFHATTGHKHSGTGTDAPEVTGVGTNVVGINAMRDGFDEASVTASNLFPLVSGNFQFIIPGPTAMAFYPLTKVVITGGAIPGGSMGSQIYNHSYGQHVVDVNYDVLMGLQSQWGTGPNGNITLWAKLNHIDT